jgi:hypothetical protein
VLGLIRDSLPLLLAAGGAALVLVLLTRREPLLGLVLWLVVVAFVPVWFGVSIIAYFQPASVVGVIVLVGMAWRLPHKFSLADLLVVFFFASCLIPVVAGRATLTTVFVVLTIWGVGYALGRIAPLSLPMPVIHSAIAVVFTGVAVAAIVEFALDWHPYSQLAVSNGLYESWGDVQIRSDRARSEWAFGHSIALGSSIALALPMTMTSRFPPWVRLMMMAVMLGGVAVTFSRIAMVSAVLAVALTLLFVRRPDVRQIRGWASVLLGLGALVAVPSLRGVFLSAGEESTLSAQYRGRLLGLVSEFEVLGFSSSASRSVTGELRFAQFQSIDSQMIYLGLTYGVVAVVCAIGLLVYASGAVLSGRAGPAVVAVVAQIPALLTVALITQYAMWFWFVAGLAVASATPTLVRQRASAREGRGSGCTLEEMALSADRRRG